MVNITPLGTRTSQWGEGPVWWRDHLYYVDIEGHAFIRLDPAAGRETVWPMGGRIGFALPCADGRWICGGDSGIYLFDPDTGARETVAAPEAHLPNNRFNDAAISPDGRLFAGTIATDKSQGAAALYRIDPDLSCHKILSGLTNSNGIDWSPDGKTMYHIDTPTQTVSVFDYDPATGALENRGTFLNTAPLIDASPDGLTVDRDGNLWVAFCHGACMISFNPANGKHLQRIDLPCIGTTSCCFGGPGLDTLYVTTGLAPKKQEPLAGRILAVTGPGLSGRPQQAFGSGLR